jgi:hypothetical protein
MQKKYLILYPQSDNMTAEMVRQILHKKINYYFL